MLLPALCAAALASLPPTAAVAAPNAHDIVLRLAARDKVLQERRKAYDYDLLITREKLDDADRVTSSTQEKVVVRGDRRPDFGTRSATPGAPDTEAQKASREEPFELLDILDHYTYTLDGIEPVAGVPCYKIAFTPKPGMPYANREEKVLNAVAGHLWASTRDYTLLRNEGTLLHPVSVAWIFASLRDMNFHFQAAPLPNGDFGPREEQYSYLVTIPFFTLHERDTRQMSNYRPTAQITARP